MESAEYEIRLKDAFTQGLGRIETRMNQFESKVGTLGSTMASVFGGISLAGAVSKGISFMSDMASTIVGLGADMEQTRISFETMLGSAKKATALLSDLSTFAKETPFSQKEVITGAKSLLAYGFEAQNLTKDLTTLGDVSAGLSIPIGDLIYLYGTLRTQGKAMSKDLREFAGRGIPIYKELGKVLGVSTDKVSDLASEGKIGFKEVEKAFQNMTAKGSMFGGLMEKQSKSLAGQWSTFKDTLEIIGTKWGEALINPLSKGLKLMAELVNLIPKIDFSAITYNFTELFNVMEDVTSIFSDMFNALGLTTDKLTAFQFVAQYLGATLRVALTPLRIVAQTFHVMFLSIQAAATALYEFGSAAKNIATGNVGAALGNIQNIKNVGSNYADSIKGIASGEIEGWKKIFNPSSVGKNGATDGGMSATGGGASATGGKAGKDIGVEKIHSGVRNINITINKLVETLKFEKYNDQSEAKLQERITRMLVAAVNDVNIMTQ